MVSRASSRAAQWIILGVAAVAATACHREDPPKPGPGAYAFTSGNPLFPYSLRVSNVSPGLKVDPGKAWSLDYDLRVDLRRLSKRFGAFTQLILAAQGLLRHDAEGYFRTVASTPAVSSTFTTTGIPVERFDGWPDLALLTSKNGSPFEGLATFPLKGEVAGVHRFQGKLEARLPAHTPPGHYQVRLIVFARVKGVPLPVMLDNFWDNAQSQEEHVLPLVAVGSPAPPRLPWTLFAPPVRPGHAGKFYRGQPGILPREDQDRLGLCGRSGFPAEMILPPGKYSLTPSFPTIFPFFAMPPVEGGLEVFSEEQAHHLRFDRGQVACTIKGPGIHKSYPARRMRGKGISGPSLEHGGFEADLRRTGVYTIKLWGHIEDAGQRKLRGGGTYQVHIAMPLSFSTSCKPGTSFLVGDRYPPKVNVNPPFPAQVTLEVDYYPRSDPARRRQWKTQGRANRFGHFVSKDVALLLFDEPGEYRSRLTATYVDGRGRLWMGAQTSSGVIAPEKAGTLVLHGTRTFPYDYKVDRPFYGGVKRYSRRKPLTRAFLPFRPSPLPDVFAPYDPRDTLFISASGFNESMVEPHLSMAVKDPILSARIQEGNRMASTAPPPLLQPRKERWLYLKDVVQISADSAAWFPADPAHADELPIRSLARGKYHPFIVPRQTDVQAYLYMGVVRPGFPVMTTALESEALGLYWLASPNIFGRHFGPGNNGDLAGDVYRIQAGAVLKDRRTGKTYYDAYSAAISVKDADGEANGILRPGERPLVSTADRDHHIFLATDTHDALEVGERLGFGGMVFPAVPADVRWTVTGPSGEITEVKGRANRLGIVRGSALVPAEEPGVYQVKVRVRHGRLRGDVVGTRDGTFWHCVLPKTDLPLLQTHLSGRVRMRADGSLRIPLQWPARLKQVRLHYAVLMPGQVLEQDVIQDPVSGWEYRYTPSQMMVQFPNLDARDFGTGEWSLADTVVFQFFLEGEDAGAMVYDSLRLVLRGRDLYNYQALMKR